MCVWQLLWEICKIAHGTKAFRSIQDASVATYVARGGRPKMQLDQERSTYAPLIEACWAQIPSARPTMEEVVTWLSQVSCVHSQSLSSRPSPLVPSKETKVASSVTPLPHFSGRDDGERCRIFESQMVQLGVVLGCISRSPEAKCYISRAR